MEDILAKARHLSSSQRQRLQDIMSSSYENMHCVNLAAYVSGYTHTPFLQADDSTFIQFRYLPHELLVTKRTNHPVPGDIAIFCRDAFPMHFAIFLGDANYISLIGQSKRVTVDPEENLHNVYLTDSVDYFQSPLAH